MRQIDDIDQRELTAFPGTYIDPAMAVPRLRGRVPGPIIAHVLVLACQQAIAAVLTKVDVDDQVPNTHVRLLSTSLIEL